MKLTNRQGRFLHKAIAKWQADGVITEQEADKLNNSFTTQSFDWKKLAKYSFWIAVVCALIAICAAVADDYIIHFIERIFESSNVALCIALSLLAGVFYFLGLRGRKKNPEKEFSNEALIFAGVLFTAGAIAYLGRAIDASYKHFSILFFLATVIYGALGLWFPSRMVWVFSMLLFGTWYGTEIGYQSGWGAYYWGMNYPLAFVFFGAGVVGIAFVFMYWPRFNWFYKSTLKIGLLYLFIALWLLSVFGNYGDIDRWYGVKQQQLLGWALLFAGVALVCIGNRSCSDTDSPMVYESPKHNMVYLLSPPIDTSVISNKESKIKDLMVGSMVNV